MGRDYYTWHETRLIYTDPSGVQVKFVLKDDEKDGHYSYGHHYDPDIEDAPDHDSQLKHHIESYGCKWLFNNGEWICKPHGKQRIESIIAKYQLSIGKLEKVYKVLNGYWSCFDEEVWKNGLKKGFDGTLIVKDATNELLWDEEPEEDNESVGSE